MIFYAKKNVRKDWEYDGNTYSEMIFTAMELRFSLVQSTETHGAAVDHKRCHFNIVWYRHAYFMWGNLVCTLAR